MNKSAFGTPKQKGNVTIYTAVPAEKLRLARGEGKTNILPFIAGTKKTIFIEIQKKFSINKQITKLIISSSHHLIL
jgi:hypothetical protein